MSEVYNSKVYRVRGVNGGSDEIIVASGGVITVQSGGSINFETGAALDINGSDLFAELQKLDGVVAGTTSASKVLIVGASKELDVLTVTALTAPTATVTTLNFAAGAVFNADTGTDTCISNACTINKMVGRVTTESLTTAAGAAQPITINNSQAAVGDFVLVTVNGGTNTRLNAAIAATVSGTGVITAVLVNNEPTNAFNGTAIFTFFLIKA